ncbi:WASH complex subunit 4-like isoform X2 [Oryza brachyantha]|uniref:WASH complex subunit 4-like isoform X2 n=1 Tax=Oryza brachyantha TaxID=4533 RepID=UPI001ADB12AF|nr:WASH complex subunit 4-like isoform X2 [Oryza brachyantha]
MASLLLEQQEKLRRHVDEWRFRSRAALAEISPDSPSTSVPYDPVRLRVAPTEPGLGAGAASLLTAVAAAEDNVDVSKFVAVISHSCLEISRLSDAASRELYRQLLLFGHTAEGGPNEALLEGEPQKTFAHSIPLLLDVYEIINGLVMILGNLLRQLDAICSVRDKNVRPLNSFKGLDLTTMFQSLGDGLLVFLLVDEILRHNGNIRSYLSLFSRMLDKVKSEADVFSVSFEDVDFLDQVVHNLQKLFDIGFFQRLVQEDSPLCSSINLIRSNKKLSDTFYSFFSESSSEIIQRIGCLKELPFDRRTVLHLLALFLFFTAATGEAPDKKPMNLLIEIFQLVPVVYIEGGKCIMLSDLIRFHCPPALSSLPPIKEACEAFVTLKNNYLSRLNEVHSRNIEAINDSLSCWSVSFQSAIHPSSQMLTEEWVRHLQKQILQGVVLADRIHMLVLSMLDLHMHLEVPLRREKAKSLCQMIVSLKAIGDLFRTKGSSLVRSLPHIINVIQSDLEQLIVPLKTKLQNEIAKGSQTSKTGFLNSLIRGGTDMETRLLDSLSLVLMALQLLEGGGSSQRQLTLSITMDILHSLGYLDIELVGVRKLISKFRILSNFWSLIDERTNCSFLYWRKEMLATWLSMVYGDACKLSWLQSIIDAFSDGMSLLTLGNVGKVTLQCYEEEIEHALRKEVVAPLCRDIETDLRLHVHSTHLKGAVFVNPTKTGVRNLSWYLRMKPLRLPSKFIDIKLLVESHLNSAFYTYSVMSNYDNRMYAEMHQLGELKYGVELEDFHLSMDTVDLDFYLKQSMENLDSFSEAYSYNIVKQMFVENDLGGQDRKNLRILCVDHIASSAATCNLQRISAYLDSIFIFLNQMVVNLHALLQSEIEIDLLRDFKQPEDIGMSGANPASQGDMKFSIGKLGLGDHALDLLEQVKAVVTRIGSVLGLMMVLTAGRTRYLNNISRYVRKPKCDLSYSASCRLLGWDDDVVEIGKVLDMTTGDNDPSEDRIQPFSLLATNFSKLQSNKLNEMKVFFQIVPSVIGHMVDCKLLLKDKVLRRVHEDKRSAHTYDGFLLGVAFVLKILEQENSFDELNWFASTKTKLEGETKVRDDKGTDRSMSGSAFANLKLWRSNPPVKTEQHKGLDDKRTRYLQEIELIECLFSLARTVLR